MAACAACSKVLVDGAAFCPHCGTRVAVASTTDPLLGKMLGNYKVLRPLAAGAMGQLYVGEQANLGRKVCIKTLQPELLGDPTVVARFEREARAVSGLRHPNIAQVIDFGRAGEHLYLVMELIEGHSLRVLIEQQAPLPLERACTVMNQILSALEEAHAAGIVHRDLKPENVLLSRLRDGSDLVKVVDFGIAKLVDEQQRDHTLNLTGTGLVCGTPGYMAPEQIAGEALDARADVYAAGVIFFELLTGKAPFEASSFTELLRLHLTCDAPRPSQVSGLPLSSDVDRVVGQALARERDARLASALELKRAIEALRPSARGSSAALKADTRADRPAVTPTCPKCGTANPLGQKFCGGCGAVLSQTAGAFEALKKVMPSQLVEHLGALPEALTAERKHVTVIFGDFSGFTSMSESMDPEKLRELMNRCFDGMVEAVNRYDGTVDKFIGDAIMVLFGAPTAHEDDPERAVRCALDMQAYLAEVNKTLTRPLAMRIGINTGEVVAGGVGGHRRMDYTVMGDVVNTAQRIESQARPGHILVSAAVKRLTDRAIGYRELAAITVKGKTEPLAVFEVEGVLGARKSLEPMVGRQLEVGKLEQLYRQVLGGKPGGVLFLGEPGMGKTRLLEDAQAQAQAQGLKVAVAHARRLVAPTQLELLRELLFSLVGGTPASVAEADQRLQSLTTLGVEVGDVLRLLHLFGSAPALAGYERDEARRLDLACVIQALLAVARKAKGLCLLLDDLHLADETSLSYLEELTLRAGDAPLAIVATARPGTTERLLKRLARRELPPLTHGELKQLLAQQLPGASLPDHVAQTIVTRADGNPFVARELIRTLIDAGALQLQGGTWSAAPTLYTLSLPDSVGQLLAARLDAASPRARALMRCGAVHGRVFPLELASAACDLGPVDVQQALSELTNKGLLVSVSQPPGCVQFRQEMLHQAVLKSIPQTDVKGLHAALAEALEQGLSSGDANPAEALARHFLGAGRVRKAASYFSLAADRLSSRSAFGAAADCLLQAVKLTLAELSATPDADEGAWGHLLSLTARAAAAQAMVAPAEALVLLEQTLQRAPASVGLKARAEALRQRGLLELKLGRMVEADASLTEAMQGEGPHATAEVRASLEADLAAVREARGDLPGATHLLLEALKRLAGASLKDKDLLWRALNQLGRVHLRIGEVKKAREFFENARSQARSVRSTVGESKALTNLAGALGTSGDLPGAEKTFLAALELANKSGDRLDVARIEYNLGRLAMSQGHSDEATKRLTVALTLATALSWREGVAAATQALDTLKAAAAKAART